MLICTILKSLENSLSRPTSLRAFVQFDSQFTEKVNDIFVTLRWNQPEFTEMIQEYQVQCSFFEDFKETCDDKNITATKLEQTVHNLTSNTTYYFRVRAHSKIVNKIVAGPYTDLIKVSTTHENPIPKLLLASNQEYKLKFTLSNFYFDQLSINPFDSNVIQIKTNSGKLNAPENISVLALTPTIAVVHWMPLKKVYCAAVTYEVHSLVNGTQHENKQFINKGEHYFPIRWMAPESLMIKIFTSQSDVWSFGVLMWEITSLGEQPYMDKTEEEVINYVRAGGRLPISLNCPSPLYQLMLRCWTAADARPNFKFCLENIIALRKNMEDTLLSPVDTI
ncbi:Proto-oncogene tyrosine-protein kinase ROS [Camponotus floridanus]|uniref:receptor protein-tyrosine kinase n=1 Tax=Camponotus floridanus TaxID=104421 RepID=E2AVF9_CAMFO|nr:Proto-oncogene tyrosine-protein kinase ROS [Camponotus floridanus]